MRRWMKWAVGVVVVAAVVAFLLFRPDKLFVDDSVDESLADAFTSTSAPATPTPTTTPTATTTETTPPGDGSAPTTPTTTTAAPTTTTSTAPGPVAIQSGAFFGIDHDASGTATVYRQGDRYVLRFEDDTDIQNGPDLLVWFLAADDYDGGQPGDFIDLGNLKGNVGGQNYELPPDYDPDVHRFVLIWCRRFSVPFAAAPLS